LFLGALLSRAEADNGRVEDEYREEAVKCVTVPVRAHEVVMKGTVVV
jgi:hypothetical protein